MVITWYRVLIALLISLTIFGCGNTPEEYRIAAENPIILRLAETQYPTYPSSQGAREFARLVEEKSAGRIKIKIYDSGKLGEESSVIEQVRFGGIDFARVGLASLADYSPKIKILTLPYLFRNSDHMWKVIEGSIGDDIKESLLKEKISCLAWYDAGARGVYNSKRKINSVHDLKGLKISIQRSQMTADFYSYIGVSLVSIKPSDVYSVLQAGSVDGVDDNIVAYYLSRNYEVAPYFTQDGHTRVPEVIIASRVTMLQLSKHDQAIIEQAAKESAIIQRRIWTAMEKEIQNSLRDNITYLESSNEENSRSAAKPIYNSFKSEEIAAIANY